MRETDAKNWEHYGNRLWEARRGSLADGLSARCESALSGCAGGKRPYLQFLLASLPLSDLELFGPDALLRAVREALVAREAFPWCAALPQRDFLLWVLCPRVGDEELSDCRGLFQRELTPRVEGHSLPDAIMEVNRWCAEHVAYRSTDGYTDSALNVYRRGWGRCGEESSFTVSALRSVGIAARQVYAPWWSHCDDNHAWVEAWDGETWRYLGACEPEPALDRGWFTSAAQRAMLTHTRCFLQGDYDDWGFLFPEVDPADIGFEDGVVSLAVTPRYGETVPVFVTVRDGEGRPVSHLPVTFSVLNMAGFRRIARRETGKNGVAHIRLGLGSVLVSAKNGGLLAEALMDTGERTSAVLTLRTPGTEDICAEFDFHAPKSPRDCPAPLSRELLRTRRETLFQCGELRRAWTDLLDGREGPAERIGGALSLTGGEDIPLSGLNGERWPLTLSAPPEQAARRGLDYSLSLLGEGGFQTVETGDIPAGGEKEIPLPRGRYRLVATLRLPNGNQLCRQFDFTLDGPRRVELTFRQASPRNLLESIPLPPFTLKRNGATVESAQLWHNFSLLCFLEPEWEPTEHILNELMEHAPSLRESGCGLYLVLPDREGPVPEKALAALQGAQVFRGEFAETAVPLARRMYLDPDKFPLVLLADGAGNGLYACAGYNVGTAALLVRLLQAAGQ